jgi:hypothetical protein
VFRIALAVAFTGSIVLASGDADARARFRMSSSSSKPSAAAATVAKPMAGQAQKPGAMESPKPFAAARPANPQPVRRRHVRSDGRSAPGGCGARTRSQQRALGDDSSGPLQFDPTLAAADDNAAEPKKATAAAPATECIALAQALATQASNQASNQATTANELLIARNQQVAANDAPKAEPAPPRVNPALVPVKPKRQAAPVVATVCYVQRDGSCVPSF